MLEPAFVDLSWLYEYSNRSDFVRNFPLRSALWIDPSWAGEVVQRLSELHSAEEPIRQLELYSGFIEDADLSADRLNRLK